MLAAPNTDDIVAHYGDVNWRIRNLYKIVNDQGEVVTFVPNGSQQALLDNLHYLNLVLKARQLGFTTFIQILMLDQCLWQPSTEVGMIAHRLDDAKRIFREKAQFAYENLEPWIKEMVPLVRCSSQEMVFANGSSFIVGTGLRSGTYQMLHISEHGKLCAQFPEKAREAKTGALNTVPPGGMIFIESTAEGQHGDFFEFCQDARESIKKNVRLTNQHYRFHFYPWYYCDRYSMTETEADHIQVTSKYEAYFDHLDSKHAITLSKGQKAWYVLKAATQHEDMKREMPSTPDEAFEAVVEGAIYGECIVDAQDNLRIGVKPPVPGHPVYTFWDIGIGDHMAIWLVQFLPNNMRRHIASYANNNLQLDHYTNWLQVKRDELKISYAGHILPHDGEKRDPATGKTFADSVRELTGIPSISMGATDKLLRINTMRGLFPFFEFDENQCSDGMSALKSYQWEKNEKAYMNKREPKHDWASHRADAFGTQAFFKPYMIGGGSSNVVGGY